MAPKSAAATAERRREGAGESLKAEVRGKFFFRGEEKFFLKGVSYGPFAPADHGSQFPKREVVRQDFALIRDLGGNAVRTFTPPPLWVLDLAGEFDLSVLAGLPWTQHVCFLEDPKLVADIRRDVAAQVKACENHPAIFAYLIGNEIPPDIVRWHGAEGICSFLHDLHRMVKDLDPSLVSYANYPPTEYLELDFLDFVALNVYLHREPDFRRYLSRLQNLANDKPLVLTEFGIDSIREGADVQAATLAWQVRAAFESGVAGTSIFSWTDEWYTGGAPVDDWAFGLVDRNRKRKPAYQAVQRLYQGPVPPPVANAPKISVVICAYNAERTMDPCLRSLCELNYPNYEVIVVNDGSTDGTLAISERYPFRIISQTNQGLSVARNVGIEAATGEIVAFTDSDCVADPDWLTYLAYRFVHDGYVAVGGPNFPPPEEARTAACVAAAPGGPTHVLLNDQVAEHIPGCNMAFRKSILEQIRGFDPMFRAAGDDVDVCWRLQNQGYAIGFSPAAVVWHFRRNTVKAYIKQQMGYGKAEALLYVKHPYRFNLLGQSKWLGRIYGDLAQSLFSRRPVIYYGTFGRGLFQTLYEAPSSVLAYLPFTLEWNVISLVFLTGAVVADRYVLLGALPLLVSFLWALTTAWQVRVDPRYDRFTSRLLIAALTYFGPLARSLERYGWRMRSTSTVERIRFEEPSQRPHIDWWHRRFYLSYWSETAKEKEDLLQAVMDFLVPRKHLIAIDQGWNNWDIEVSRGVLAKANLAVAVENHGGRRRLFRLSCTLRSSLLGRASISAWAGLTAAAVWLGLPEIAVAASLVGLVSLAVGVLQTVRLGQVMCDVIEIVAQRLEMTAVSRQDRAAGS